MGELKIYGRSKTLAKKFIDKNQANFEEPLKKSKLKENKYKIIRHRVTELKKFTFYLIIEFSLSRII